jgi:hypothetical protein
MAELATTDRPKPIPLKVRGAIKSLATGECKTVTAAAEKAGLSREHLSRQLARPHVSEYLHQQTRRHLATAAARAGAVKAELLDSSSEIVRDRASSFVLGLAGIQPASQPSVNLNIGVTCGYVIDLRDDDEMPPKVVDHV